MGKLTIDLPDPTEARLRKIATAAGKPVEQLVTDVLAAQSFGAQSLRKLCGPSYQKFLASGLTEEELAELLEREDHATRGVRYDE